MYYTIKFFLSNYHLCKLYIYKNKFYFVQIDKKKNTKYKLMYYNYIFAIKCYLHIVCIFLMYFQCYIEIAIIRNQFYTLGIF